MTYKREQSKQLDEGFKIRQSQIQDQPKQCTFYVSFYIPSFVSQCIVNCTLFTFASAYLVVKWSIKERKQCQQFLLKNVLQVMYVFIFTTSVLLFLILAIVVLGLNCTVLPWMYENAVDVGYKASDKYVSSSLYCQWFVVVCCHDHHCDWSQRVTCLHLYSIGM